MQLELETKTRVFNHILLSLICKRERKFEPINNPLM